MFVCVRLKTNKQTKSNILFTFSDLDRSVIKRSIELDNRAHGTGKIDARLGSITKQFDWIRRDQIDYRSPR